MQEPHSRQKARYYWPHHFVFYPINFALFVLCAFQWFHNPADRMVWMALMVATLLIGLFAFIVRQHYALILQDRIILLEIRYRYFILTGKRFERLEAMLSLKQIFALRFASDEELPELTEMAIKENLSPRKIKEKIRIWTRDDMRV